ncbi:MAG: BON domain protein [Syntrophorhabdaceae bacterium PtaU1.Bin034]|nr:MAG: BON domain protein [Syntrophorhabdaceae bacterium PtaU1.Bin034]
MKRVVRFFVLCAVCLTFLASACTGCKSRTSAPPTGPKTKDSTIAEEIKKRAGEDPAIDIDAIKILVLEGNVTLHGAIPNEEARQRLLTAARSVPGVRTVSDNLELPKIK